MSRHNSHVPAVCGLALYALLQGAFSMVAATTPQGAWKEQLDAGRKCVEDHYTDCDPHLYIERALTIAEREHASPLDIARILAFRAFLVPLHLDEAARDVTRAIRLVESASGKNSPDLVPFFEDLASVRSLQGNYEQERNILGYCLQIREKVFGPDAPQVALSTSLLGAFYSIHGPPAKAEELLRRGVDIALKSRNTNAILNAYAQLSGFLRTNGRTQEADDYDKKHFELSVKQPPQQPDDSN